MADQLKVFVSHSHEDTEFCRTLVQALRQAGADVWYDEHNLGSGQLMEVIQRELDARPIFVLILSKHAFASKWVKRETTWAYDLYDRDPSRLLLPVTAGPIERDDFSGATGWLFLHDFKRIEAPGRRPYPTVEAARRLLHALELTPSGEAPTAPAPPQPTESAEDLLTRGKALAARHKYAEALPLLQRVTQLAPRSFGAWANLGWTYFQSGQHGPAVDAFEQALALDATQAWAWRTKGVALCNLKRYEEALSAFDRVLALDPKDAFALRMKGMTLHDLGRYGDALAAHDQEALRLGETAGLVHQKAVALRALGRIAEAEAAERRVKELGGLPTKHRGSGYRSRAGRRIDDDRP